MEATKINRINQYINTDGIPSHPVDIKTSIQKCHPISKFSDLEQCLRNPPDWAERVIPLKKGNGFVLKNVSSNCHIDESKFCVRQRYDQRAVPKTLVCHDYKGGYLEDSYIPFENELEISIAKEGYSFYNWSQIDYFVYFSHHFITIPPLGWINAGHNNGVKVLGTIITENYEGLKICNEEIFNNYDKMREFVYQLIELIKIFQFDGWLLNIENEVNNPDILRDFVKLLTEKAHQQNSENVVLWYDSVTINGSLMWQNELNMENSWYFDHCDGIFLNYGWSEYTLKNTADFAGSRRFDVFVGVDIFGRNMYSGGKLNTFKALDLISKFNLSVAIFAPGWTYETLSKNPLDTHFSRFLNRDDAFWLSLQPYLHTHPINNYFETDFSLGLKQNNYNLFMQKQQLSKILYPEDITTIPNSSAITPLQQSCDCLKRSYFHLENVCLISNEKIEAKNNSRIVHYLFGCDLQLNGKIGIYYLSKNLMSNLVDFDILLLISLKSGSCCKIKLLGNVKRTCSNSLSLQEINPLPSTDIKPNTHFDILHKRHKSRKHSSELKLSFYEFTVSACTLLEIGVAVQNNCSINLVEFGIFPIHVIGILRMTSTKLQ